jgi:DNA polymerase-3 subunit alpha
LTSHPLTEFADELDGLATHTTVALRDLDDGKDAIVGGMISSIKKAQTKNPSRSGNSRYVNFDLEDANGAVRCILWPDDFALHGDKIVADAICVLEGRVDRRGRQPNLIVNKVHTLEEAERKFTRQVAIKFRRGFHTEEDMRRVRDIVARHPGGTPLAIVLETWEEPNGADRTSAGGNGSSAASTEPSTQETVRLDAEHGAPPSPARGTRLRAVLATATQVCADQALKSDLTAVLGKDGFRYVRRTPKS